MKIFFTFLFASLFFFACQKANSVSVDQGVIAGGNYKVTGSVTHYLGPAADSIIRYIDILDTIKDVMATSSNEYICAYGTLGTSGWNYVITVDSNKQTVTALDGDETILTSTTANSFRKLEATYTAASKTFHFKSLYTSTSGNDVIVNEILTKQ